MLKRPINARFREPVLRDIKTTTIREKAWPVGVPIMLYSWSGDAYRSKQIDVAAIIVAEVRTIKIQHLRNGELRFLPGHFSVPWRKEAPEWEDRWLFETEGFATADELHAWFRPLVKRGQTVEKTLMLFRRSNVVHEPHAPKKD